MADIHPELQNFSAFLSEAVTHLIGEVENGVFREAAFIQWVTDLLADAGETGNALVCHGIHYNKAGNRTRQISGYSLWDNYETLDIFITAFRNDLHLYTLDKNRVLTSLNLANRYLEYAWKGEYSGIEDSAEEREFLENFRSYSDKLSRVRLILITNGLAKTEIPDAKTTTGNLTVINEVWDLERIYQLWSSGRKREPIAINLPVQYKQKIKCLSLEAGIYTAYIAIIPGKLLADLYDYYGSRLLEQNVRVYLQNKGKVNKEIRKTILDTPEMLMAYNNGISATATAIEFVWDPETGEEIIGTIRGLQIVNGGQTTSSIYYAWKSNRKKDPPLYLQLKITLLKDDLKTAEIVSRISRYANSQNKVTETDLTSNQNFHIVLEELSRTTWTPSMPGSSLHTRWYYERAKGQYREDINREYKPTRKQNFKEKNPLEQVIRKDEFAKFRNVWNRLPFWVARGSQKNYLHFIAGEGEQEPTRDYFKDTAAIAILFKAAEKIYGKKPDAMGDLRYIVVPYALAWLIQRTNDRLDLKEIWSRQALPAELRPLLRTILLQVNSYFQEQMPAEYALISEWAKKEECWNTLKSMTLDIDLQPIAQLLIKDDQISNDSAIVSGAIQEVVSFPVEKWEVIEQFGTETGKLDPIQIGAVRNIISRLKKQKPLTEQLIQYGRDAAAIYDGEEQLKKII